MRSMTLVIALLVSLGPFIVSSGPISYHSLSEARSTDQQPMWQLSGKYQGDMVLIPGQRNGVIDERLRWNNREIVYEISSDFTESEKQFIINSLTEQYLRTCITPRQRRAGDVDYVYVTGKDTGCWSYVGRLGGQQELNLQRNGCLWVGTIAHEFLHALGFYHEQSSTERDDYVTILWNNIIPGTEHNFDKYGSNMITNFNENYDYESIMHYDKYAFSVNGLPTIEPKDPSAVIGQSLALSQIDIAKLNKMYKCV